MLRRMLREKQGRRRLWTRLLRRRQEELLLRKKDWRKMSKNLRIEQLGDRSNWRRTRKTELERLNKTVKELLSKRLSGLRKRLRSKKHI